MQQRLGIAIAAVLAAALVHFSFAAMAQGVGQSEVKQIQLTEKQLQGVVAAQKDVAAVLGLHRSTVFGWGTNSKKARAARLIRSGGILFSGKGWPLRGSVMTRPGSSDEKSPLRKATGGTRAMGLEMPDTWRPDSQLKKKKLRSLNIGPPMLAPN